MVHCKGDIPNLYADVVGTGINIVKRGATVGGIAKIKTVGQIVGVLISDGGIVLIGVCRQSQVAA